MAMERTPQQKAFIAAIIEAAQNGGGKNFCLRARAGTGKTASVVEMVHDYVAAFPAHEIVCCAFNKAAANELDMRFAKLGLTNKRQVAASTVHALGYGIVRFVFKNPKLDDHKVRNICREQNSDVYATFESVIVQLVKLAKLEGFGFFPDVQIGDTHAWYRMANHYDINGFDDTSMMDPIVAAAQHIYKLSLAKTDVIDFDDMILFPLVKNLRVKFQKDLLVVDEAQDTGRARQALVKKFVKRDGILIAVGDDRQGIYGFAGAQSDALEQLISGLDMEILPLTICWRCASNVIREAQKIVADIEWSPSAIDGEVLKLDAMPEVLLPTDAILCRNTAPLIEQAYSLLRRGIACRVEGREIGTGLLKMVNRWKVKTIDAFLRKLDDYKEREMQKATARGNDTKAAEVEDRCATLVHICNACLHKQQTSLDDVRKFIDDMFGDDVSGVVTLCTYHRSKGREWMRVFLLQHASRCPSKWAKQDWQIRQEQNLAYVAITRAQQTLAYVG